MADKRKTNKKKQKQKRCIAQGAIKSQTAQIAKMEMEEYG